MQRKEITTEKLKEFWKHKLHPITGYGAIIQRTPSCFPPVKRQLKPKTLK